MSEPSSPHRSTFEKICSWWTAHPLYDPAHEFQLEATFEESHCILGGIARWRDLGTPPTRQIPATVISDRPDPGSGGIEDAMVRQDLLAGSEAVTEQIRVEAGIAAFCERVYRTRGIQGAPEALFMGYGLDHRNGLIKHSCVADQCSVANAVLDAVSALTTHSNQRAWLETIETWATWVQSEFAGPDGGIGVGIFNYQWNPMKVYWCATTLFTAACFRLTRLTGSESYRATALAGLDWLARFDFRESIIPDFNSVPGGALLYFGEGITEGLQFLAETGGVTAARSHPAAAKAHEILDWLANNQQESGALPQPRLRGHRSYELGLPWLVTRLNRILGPDLRCEEFNRRFLDHLTTEEGCSYYGLYIRPWAMGLAQLSFGAFLNSQQHED